MKNWILTIAALAALTPFAALADDVSYSFFEVNYTDVDLAGISESGFGLKGSASVADNFHIGIDYFAVSFPLGVDFNRTSLGFGYHTEGETSFYATVALEKLDLGLADDDGYGIELGGRGFVADDFELQGYIGVIDVFDETETYFGVSGRYWFNENMAIGLDYKNTEISILDVDILQIGFRYSFGS